MVRDFRAQPEAVYNAWTDLSHVTDWWGPEGFIVPEDRVSMDSREGGRYQACMVNTITGDELWWGGTLERLDPPDHLSMTQQWEQPDGTPASNTTLITVDLEAARRRDADVFRAGALSEHEGQGRPRNGLELVLFPAGGLPGAPGLK